ncbi:MAG TPA: phosphoribosyltransferase family protein [Steroidobacteraceae bacterium]
MRRFADRADAGRQLAKALAATVSERGAIVLGLPRGGVPVAAEIASELRLPLDVLCVRKLGVPFQPELAMGALASGGAIVRNEDVLATLPSAETAFARVLAAERAELERREHIYRGEAPPLDVRERLVVLVDDGLATGATMEAAVQALRALAPAAIVVAVPVGSREAVERIAAVADRVVCLHAPIYFGAVGSFYESFEQTGDSEVTEVLAAARRRREPDEDA